MEVHNTDLGEVLFVVAAIFAAVAGIIPETRAPRLHLGWLAVAVLAVALLCQ